MRREVDVFDEGRLLDGDAIYRQTLDYYGMEDKITEPEVPSEADGTALPQAQTPEHEPTESRPKDLGDTIDLSFT